MDRGDNSTSKASSIERTHEKTATMADTGGTQPQKMEVDYSSTVDEKLPKCEKLAKVNTISFVIFTFNRYDRNYRLL